MGLYSSICPECNVKFLWFSGNTGDQRCDDCKNPKDKKVENMDYQQAHLDSLNKVISVQNELITFLRAKIERLKLTGLYINTPNTNSPSGIPGTNPPWYAPNQSPWITTPYNPNIGPINPYIITCGDPVPTSIGTNCPPTTGTVSAPPIGNGIGCTSHEMVKWGDNSYGGESCKKCGFGSGWCISSNSTTFNNQTLENKYSISTAEVKWPEAPENVKPKKKK